MIIETLIGAAPISQRDRSIFEHGRVRLTQPIGRTPPVIDDTDWIVTHRQAWRKKAALRRYYERDIFDRIRAELKPGRILELGSGPGFFAADRPEIVAMDITAGPRSNVVADAHVLPFQNAAFANVVGIDVFHHLARPGQVLSEVARVLSPDGRLVLIEPWTGAFGRFIYRHFHHEDCAAVPDPWAWAAPAGKDPMAGNAVIPKAVLADSAIQIPDRIPGLSSAKVTPFGAVSFLFTGGFQNWGAPWPLVRLALRVENMMPRAMMSWLALRALFVIEKQPSDGAGGLSEPGGGWYGLNEDVGWLSTHANRSDRNPDGEIIASDAPGR